MNTFLKRLFTGVVYVSVILAGTIIHPYFFGIVFLLLMVLTQLEFYKLMENSGYYPQKILASILGGIVFIICFSATIKLVPYQLCFLFFPLLVVLFTSEILSKKSNTFKNAFITLFGFIYISVPFSLLNFIVFPGFPGNSDFYPWILVGIFLIIWVYDSMAYVGGTQFGKHKMSEKISPNKSWEGLIIGAVFAIIMGILNAVVFQSLSIAGWIISAIIVVVFGTFGDLFESKIKREINVKDSGNILPGHGGFLDRLDSLLFIIPVIYLWLLIGGNL